MKLLLASSSPRRIELLQQAGYDFSVVPTATNEEMNPNLPIPLAVEQIALEKAKSVESDAMIISADTVVVYEQEVLGKPSNIEHAKSMLRLLSGQTHEVITGVAIIYQGQSLTFHDVSEVTFEDLSDEWIDNYIKNYHPLDKAGAYGLQDDSEDNHYVKKVTGDTTTVIGLPMIKLKSVLAELLAEVPHDSAV